jgi:hypothetical protein
MRLPAVVAKELDEYVKETTGRPLAYYALRRGIGTIGAEVLYIQDEGDPVVPVAEARAIEGDRHPNIRFVFTQGFGHKKVYKDQEVMDQIVEFL